MVAGVRRLIVVGHGAAGLTAAVAAAEFAREHRMPTQITLVEKASESEAGGNTRWSPSYMRMAAVDRLTADFEADMLAASGGRGEPEYFAALAENAVETVQWLARQGVEFLTPTYYLSVGPPRIQPNGGGGALIEKLSQAAKRIGINIHYGCAASRLVLDDRRRVSGLDVKTEGNSISFQADAVLLATGGFQGNAEMMDEYFGKHARAMRLISPGTRFATGDGIRIGHDIGAAMSGDWNGMHAEPVDPRSNHSAPVVLVYPYGIVVDRNGQRFCDEGAGLVHETWEAFAREIHFSCEDSIAYAILDSRLFEISGYERAIRSDVPPIQAQTVEDLAALIKVPFEKLRQTLVAYNAAATGDAKTFDPTRCDGLATARNLTPTKSNWARPITQPPFVAYPLVGAIAYTFGGLASTTKAEVLSESGIIPGLYAAGEVTGQFYGTAPNAVAVLRAAVFGRIAGRESVHYIHASQ